MSNARQLQKPVRINLHLGAGTDATLVRVVRSLRPYARAKFARALINEAWRRRRHASNAKSVMTAGRVPALHPLVKKNGLA